MCGRFFRHTPRDELAAAFHAELGHSSAAPAYNVAPGTPIITVRFNSKTGTRTLDDLQWGLIPHFAKDAKIAWRTINARAETVDTSAMFRRAFEKRRSLIAVDARPKRQKAPEVLELVPAAVEKDPETQPPASSQVIVSWVHVSLRASADRVRVQITESLVMAGWASPRLQASRRRDVSA